MERFIIIAAVLVVVIVVTAFRASGRHFECPNCGEHFQVNPFWYVIAPHGFGQRNVRCPKCGKVNFLASKPGKK